MSWFSKSVSNRQENGNINKTRFLCVCLSVLMVILFLADILFGSVSISFSDCLKGFANENSVSRTILFEIRIPKAIGAILVGVSLSVSGLLMQTFFRNPLAGPYVLGVSSGASLGVAIFMLMIPILGISVGSSIIQWGCAIFALGGAVLLFLLILFASLRLRESVSLLVVGMLLGSVAGAVITILQNLSDPESVKFFVNWTFGSLSLIGWQQLVVMSMLVVTALVLMFQLLKSLDALLVGEDFAMGVGVDVRRVRIIVVVVTVLLTGGTTAFAGPIGFVGLAVPHVARLLVQTSIHRQVMPCTFLLGGCVMLLSDILSQLPNNGYIIPINAITALLGIPVVLWVVYLKHT